MTIQARQIAPILQFYWSFVVECMCFTYKYPIKLENCIESGTMG